jgi:PAS domain S-box-containing protein
VNTQASLRLSDFILEQMEPILQAWEDFARTIEPPAFEMDAKDLRDQAAQMLMVIAADLNTPQSALEQVEKSQGRGKRQTKDTPAETHAAERLKAGFTIEQLISEYRALRSSVLSLWANSMRSGLATDPDDVTRFNEAIDQALAESVGRYAQISKEQAESERRRLDAVLEAAPVGIALADINGKLILDNPENRLIWGERPIPKSVDEYAGWKGYWADGSTRHGRLLEPHEWPLARALTGERSPHDIIEIEPFGVAGQRRTIVLHAVPIRDSSQHIVGGIVAQMDITGQVRAEAALRESEARFRTIANAMPQMVWSTLPDGYHDYYNQQWYDYIGMPEGSTDGKGWNGILHPEDQPIAWDRWQHSLQTGEVYEIQYRLRHHSGQYRWVLGRALPVRDDAGRITRWMGTCTDIHDQKLAEEELRESGQRKDDFLAMLAHELRNPLAPIHAAAELLTLAGYDEKRARQASEIITRQVDHMTDLINDLLDVSRVTRGLVILDQEIVDLQGVITGALEQARPLIETKQHKLWVRTAFGSAHVKGDKTRLVQIIANLLTNAAKYTPQGGQIELVLDIKSTKAEIRISDNGIGIEPTLLPHIFKLFTQGQRTPDRAQGGLGLGLSLVKSLTNLHGGQVIAHSEGLGKGSVFTLILPLSEKEDSHQSDDNSSKQLLGQKADPVSLMIVDDNLDAATSLASLLEAAGHEVIVCESGKTALEAVAKGAPQVFILDIGLPDMDGYEIAKRLRNNPFTATSVLIALTGYGQDHDRMRSKAAGFDHHFVKPIDTHQLATILSQVT